MSDARKIPFGKPIIGEPEQTAVAEVLASGIMAHGPRVEAFEEAFRAFTGAPHAVAVGSCTAAMHLAWLACDLGPGDEVIVPAMTHVATAHAVSYTGARPVFVDATAKSGNIDPDAVKASITPKTRAISLVHYLGRPADMDALRRIAQKHGLRLLEDCALALGSFHQGTHCGLLGDAGCFSFYPVKHITTAEGGMLVTTDEALAATVRKRRAFGMDKHVGQRTTPGLYDVDELGYNYRINEIQAALGVEQMKRLPGFLETRRHNHAMIEKGLQDIAEIEVFKAGTEGSESSCYCLVFLLGKKLAPKRHEVIHGLKSRGVGTSIYYPHPVPRMRYYAERYGYTPGQFPVAERIADAGVALPVGPHVDDDDVVYMIEAVEATIHEVA